MMMVGGLARPRDRQTIHLGERWGGVFSVVKKGKKDTSEVGSKKAHSRTSRGKPPSRAGNDGASSRGPSISFCGAGDEGPSSNLSESGEDVPRTTWRFLR